MLTQTKQAIENCMRKIATEDPSTPSYQTLLQNTEILVRCVAEDEFDQALQHLLCKNDSSDRQEVPQKTKPESKTKTKAKPEAPAPEKTPDPNDLNEIKYQLPYIRARLRDAKTQGFDTVSLVKRFGVTNLTSIPESAYPEIVAEIQAWEDDFSKRGAGD